jgi:hypothetical protein
LGETQKINPESDPSTPAGEDVEEQKISYSLIGAMSG